MTNKIDGSLVGELILGEQSEWYVGVCTVRYDDMDEHMLVYGENDLMVGTVSTDVWTEGLLASEVKDLSTIADRVNGLIKAEHEEL